MMRDVDVILMFFSHHLYNRLRTPRWLQAADDTSRDAKRYAVTRTCHRVILLLLGIQDIQRSMSSRQHACVI
jgi:hypothetical protein